VKAVRRNTARPWDKPYGIVGNGVVNLRADAYAFEDDRFSFSVSTLVKQDDGTLRQLMITRSYHTDFEGRHVSDGATHYYLLPNENQ
jgi:hypothetical protein